jgi:hypothetical protein
MLKFKPVATLLAITALGYASPATSAPEHVVTRAALAERVAGDAAQRESDIAAVRGILATSQGAGAMHRLGANPVDVRARVATLSPSDLRDLAARARALQVDPTAGLSSDVNSLLVIFLVVAIVVLVLGAVD